MLGSIFLSLSFASALVAFGGYALSMKREDERYLRMARTGFHTMVFSFMLTCAVLLYLIMTHQYQYDYVWAHSSNSLADPYLFAAFYSGQEGSFMLWTLMTMIVGVFMMGSARRVDYEVPTMSVLTLVLLCLLLIIVVQSPFVTIHEAHADQNLPLTFVPTDGKGLNPTLENPWITIHPPILFSGFAAMTVPFVFALAGLIRRDYQRWVSISLPWTLFATMVLGFGIMLGGWWAYETLGWGGFWAWDPVENSSLIPWLVGVGLVHTMLVQKRTGERRSDGRGNVGGLVKTNFALAIAAYGLILYSTFLTRSGVLGDTSVHSFVSPGFFVYLVLLGIIALFVGLGIGLLIWRWKELHQESLAMRLMSRENALAIGSAVLLFSAVVVFIGTSWPLFLPLFGKPKVAIPVDFYNNLHLPIAIAIVLLNGISMTLKWRNTTRAEFFKRIGLATVIAVAGTVGLVALGITHPIYILLGFGSILAIVVNVQIGYRVLRGNPRFIGAYVSHGGVALMMLGIIFTAKYSVTEHVRLVEGEPSEVFGYQVTYEGAEQIELEKTDREKYRHTVVLEKNGSRDVAQPIIFWSDFNRRESPFMEPGILYTATRDIYVSPKAIEQEGGDPVVRLHKGESTPVPFDSSLTVRFEKFDMSRAASEQQQGAVLEVSTPDSSYFVTVYRTMSGQYRPVPLPGTDDATVGFAHLEANRENLSASQALFIFSSPSHPSPPAKSALVLDVSIKPFISFVWAGVVIMVGGFFFSILRRRRELFTQYRRQHPETGRNIAEGNGRTEEREVKEEVTA